MAAKSLSQYVRSNHPPTGTTFLRYRGMLSESESNAWDYQETELQMRTSELIEENAQQALGLLVQYAQSSCMLVLLSHCLANPDNSRRRTEPAVAQLHNLLDARSIHRGHHQISPFGRCFRRTVISRTV